MANNKVLFSNQFNDAVTTLHNMGAANNYFISGFILSLTSVQAVGAGNSWLGFIQCGSLLLPFEFICNGAGLFTNCAIFTAIGVNVMCPRGSTLDLNSLFNGITGAKMSITVYGYTVP